MITQDTFTTCKIVIKNAISKMPALKISRQKFILEIVLLFLGIRGRYNFVQFSREGNRNEKSFRYQFEKPFDWMRFNINIVNQHCGDEKILGFDPSYIRKSGKHSPGLGHFYSGCQSRYIKGLEVGSFAAIDVKQRTAFHLEAVLSPVAKYDRIDKDKTLIDHYADCVVERSASLREVSTVLVCDAYFTKKKFIDKVCDDADFEMIGRTRDDANLRYLYKGDQNKGRGRPKVYDGKVDTKNIDKRRIRLFHEDEKCRIYSGILNSISLKRNIKIAYVEHILANGKIVTKIYFSTNLKRKAIEILDYYRLRFQMEFLFRDGKQHVGLEHCQARSKNKLNFHLNASLSTVSVAKIATRNKTLLSDKSSFSMSDVKTEFQNRNFANRFISMYPNELNLQKIKNTLLDFLNFGKIAA